MTFKSYAQNFEDVLLWRALKGVQNGFYIDIGANDPVDDSVSAGFYEKGWRGIHVEPIKYFADRLRKFRPDEIVLENIVSDKAGLETIYSVKGTGLSTGVQEIGEQYLDSDFETILEQIPSLSLKKILSDCKSKDIHWLKIDVEGMERQVLSSWGKASARPWILVIESTLPNSRIEEFESWEHFIFDREYEFAYFDGLNRYYVHKNHIELKEHFGLGVNFFDDFVLGSATNYGRGFIEAINAAERETVHSKQLLKSMNDRLVDVDHQRVKLSENLEQVLADKEAQYETTNALVRSLNDRLVDVDHQRVKLSEHLEQVLADKEAQYETTNALVRSLNDRLDEINSRLAEANNARIAAEEKYDVERGARIAAESESTAFFEHNELLGKHNNHKQAHIHAIESQLVQALCQLEQSNNYIAETKRSLSWKLAKPIRGAGVIVFELKNALRSILRILLVRALEIVRTYPALKRIMLACLTIVPPLKRKFVLFGQMRGGHPVNQTVLVEYTELQITPNQDAVSAWMKLLSK